MDELRGPKRRFDHQNEHAVEHVLEDYSKELHGAEAVSLDGGEAAVFGERSDSTAVYRDENGE